MSKFQKLFIKILVGKSDKNIQFIELCNLLEYLGFDKRIRGNHHIFRRDGIETRLNLQKDGKMAKSYQVAQVRKMIINNNLGDIFYV